MPLNFAIPEQNFERIRTQVAAILAIEFPAQLALRPTETEFGAGVWLERGVPYDVAELPAVKVYFASSSFDDDGRVSSAGTCQINIEVTTRGTSSAIQSADVQAALICQKLLGAIRYIFKHPSYNKLAFTGRPFIKGITVSDLRMGAAIEDQDAFRIISGQVILQVRYEETNGDLSTLEMDLASTSVKIENTDKGIKIEKIV